MNNQIQQTIPTQIINNGLFGSSNFVRNSLSLTTPNYVLFNFMETIL